MVEGEFEQKLNGLRQDVSELKSVFKDLLRECKSESDGGQEMHAYLNQRINQCRTWMKDTMDQVRDRGHKSARQMEKRVEEHPMKSVITAFVVGILMGKLVLRR